MKTLFFNSYQGYKNAEGLCNILGGKYHTAPTQWKDNQLQILKDIKSSDVVIIWNGMEPSSHWIKDLCERNNTQYVFMEYGFLRSDVRDSYYLDPEGSSCCSSLNNDISWLTKEQINNSKEKIRNHLNKINFSNKGKEFVLCPLQVPWDTSIYLCSKYSGDMKKFLIDVAEKFPEKKIIATDHPQNEHNFNLDDPRLKNVSFEYKKTTMELAQYAEIVVGINSTVLYETLAAGKKTISLGNGPIKSQNGNIKVVYAALSRQFKKTDTENFYRILKSVLKQKNETKNSTR